MGVVPKGSLEEGQLGLASPGLLGMAGSALSFSREIAGRHQDSRGQDGVVGL